MIEFVVMGTPLSQQASSWRKAAWKSQVAAGASKAATFGYICPLRVTLAYFCPVLGVDIDNIVKPILDAMKGILYEDDRRIVQVQTFAIEIADAARIANATVAIATGLETASDFVVVRVEPARPTEELL